jgi:ADP-heptose:LPS heptosyltransferase
MACIENAVKFGLDLVIAVDTSVAHLAGALGRPVWLLSRYDGCWRWLQRRDDSPWYPGMRIYRQERPGDWSGVIERLRSDLVVEGAKAGPAHAEWREAG